MLRERFCLLIFMFIVLSEGNTYAMDTELEKVRDARVVKKFYKGSLNAVSLSDKLGRILIKDVEVEEDVEANKWVFCEKVGKKEEPEKDAPIYKKFYEGALLAGSVDHDGPKGMLISGKFGLKDEAINEYEWIQEKKELEKSADSLVQNPVEKTDEIEELDKIRRGGKGFIDLEDGSDLVVVEKSEKELLKDFLQENGIKVECEDFLNAYVEFLDKNSEIKEIFASFNRKSKRISIERVSDQSEKITKILSALVNVATELGEKNKEEATVAKVDLTKSQTFNKWVKGGGILAGGASVLTAVAVIANTLGLDEVLKTLITKGLTGLFDGGSAGNSTISGQ